MGSRLEAILAAKRAEVAGAKRATPVAELRARCVGLPPARGFAAALRAAVAPGRLGVVAEAKRASPSAGQIATDYDAAALARAYASGGANCLSILTERDFFAGEPAHLQQARAACALPVLRKDFVLEEWQVHETRAMEADCMLLIAAALEAGPLRDLTGLGQAAGMDVLIEVHAEDEVEAALAAGPDLLGVNNRNLATFVTDLATTERLVPLLAGARCPVIAESAIRTVADASRMLQAGAQAVLVGEALMRAVELPALLRALGNPEGA